MLMNDIDLDRLTIIRYPDPGLVRVAEPITDFGPALAALAERMLVMMAQANGVGLAAPQLGLALRLFVCNHTAEPEDNRVVVNPELHDLEGAAEGDEGCLSIPDVTVRVRRPERCRLVARDVTGAQYEVIGDGLQARVWQHENDHLDGKLILRYMDEADRLANRRAIKSLEDAFKRR